MDDSANNSVDDDSRDKGTDETEISVDGMGGTAVEERKICSLENRPMSTMNATTIAKSDSIALLDPKVEVPDVETVDKYGEDEDDYSRRESLSESQSQTAESTAEQSHSPVASDTSQQEGQQRVPPKSSPPNPQPPNPQPPNPRTGGSKNGAAGNGTNGSRKPSTAPSSESATNDSPGPSSPPNPAPKNGNEGNGASGSKSKDEKLTGGGRPKAEREGFIYYQQLRSYIEKNKGQFVRDEDGSLHVIIKNKRIPLNFDYDNYDLSGLMLEACRVTSLTQSARIGIQRLQVLANEKSRKLRLRRFAALSNDNERLYIPLDSGELLCVSAEDIKTVVNGNNPDSIWLEHPFGDPPKYLPSDSIAGLEQFERSLVDTQACKKPEMRWFVGMHEGLFPFVRDLSPARLILVHQGPSQQGKTSGAKRYVLLHGLGDVLGDFSVAALGNLKDLGLLALDNKEQANLTQPLIDFLLFVSTGGQRGRSSVDGAVRFSNQARPVAVLTTIEGVYKPELENRCVEVQYGVVGEKIPRAPIEQEIKQRRSEMFSAMVSVLQRFLQVRKESKPTPNPRPEFEEHFNALCDLLRAYAEVAGKPSQWSEKIIKAWAKILGQTTANEDELERPLLEILRDSVESQKLELLSTVDRNVDLRKVAFEGQEGTLIVTTSGYLLSELQKRNFGRAEIPKSPEGLARRLRSKRFLAFRVLDEESAPLLPDLKRKKGRRPIGFFVPSDDGMTVGDSTP